MVHNQEKVSRREAGQMQPTSFAVAVLLLSIFALGNNAGVSATTQSTDRDQQAKQEREFLARRENFTSGRELLLNKRVPFDPDELLHDGWTEKLKPTLDALPEMHQNRYETAPMKGAYMAVHFVSAGKSTAQRPHHNLGQLCCV